MNWYYVEAGQQMGPVDDAALAALVAGGRINAETLVWREGMANWQPYRELLPGGATAAAGGGAYRPAAAYSAPGAGAAPGGEEAVCAECGGIFPVNDTIRIGEARVCANCKPVFVQKMREGVAVGGAAAALQYAGFWIRVGAYILDSLILGAVNFVIQLLLGLLITGMGGTRATPGSPPDPAMVILGLVVICLAIAVPVCYETIMVGKFGATLGKMACKIRVVRSDGTPVGYGLAFGRFFARIVSAIICYVGFMMAGWDEEKRALHDRMCDTRVVYN